MYSSKKSKNVRKKFAPSTAKQKKRKVVIVIKPGINDLKSL
jgi:hypothetical protein